MEIDQHIVHGIITKQLRDFDAYARAIVGWLDKTG
jgi:hypothetical protein